MPAIIYKILLLTLLSLFSIIRNDLYLIVTVFLLISVSFFYEVKLKHRFIEIVFLLLSIFFIALFSTFFESHQIYAIGRDAWYLLKPVLVIYAAYFVTSKLDDKEFFFRAVIYIGIIAAIFHLIRVVPEFLGESKKISEIRGVSGKGNIVEIFSLAFLYLNKENKFIKTKNIKLAIYAILISSIISYFSRTMALMFFMALFSMKGYLMLTKTSLKYISLLIIGIFAFFAYLQTLDLDANSPGLKGFLYKIRIAPSELTKTEIDVTDHRDLWDHFRAYESSKAIEESKEKGLRAIILGNGLGSLVDLDFEARLAGKEVRFIPIIHNGYVFVFFKAGLIGLFVYLLFLITLYLKVYNHKISRNYIITSRFLSTIGVYYVFTSLVITGVYNPSDPMAVFLGGALFLESYYKKLELN